MFVVARTGQISWQSIASHGAPCSGVGSCAAPLSWPEVSGMSVECACHGHTVWMSRAVSVRWRSLGHAKSNWRRAPERAILAS